jgi:hypothetical protein
MSRAAPRSESSLLLVAQVRSPPRPPGEPVRRFPLDLDVAAGLERHSLEVQVGVALYREPARQLVGFDVDPRRIDVEADPIIIVREKPSSIGVRSGSTLMR